MVEDRNENLQPADGKNEQTEAQQNSVSGNAQNNPANDAQDEPVEEEKKPVEEEANEEPKLLTEASPTEETAEENEAEEEAVESKDEKLEKEAQQLTEEKSVEDVVDEIEKNIATESEEEHEEEEHHEEIPFLSYKDFDLDTLLEEAQKLLATYPVQKIRKHLTEIKNVFDDKVVQMQEKHQATQVDSDEEKPELKIPQLREFRSLWKEYKDKYRAYKQEIQERLEANLKKRHELIEELKNLIDSTEFTFEERLKKFKDIQKRWRTAGRVSSGTYQDIWQTFKHHEERFYDLLDLDRGYRDKVFEENLKQKQSIIEQAKALLDQNDIHKIFKELQLLHKKWKEETGPVAREYREKIWEEFKEVTKQIHDKRRDFYKKLKEEFKNNLVKKQEIIAQLKELTAEIPTTHKEWQDKIKEVEKLREAFYQIGYVPKKYREEVWNDFKSTIKEFNKHKNNFYKSLKELQKENLDKKKELIRIAEELKDSEDWEAATEKFKEIQAQWKEIGHVPRKFSEKIWQEFRTACNHYFDRYYAHIRSAKSEEFQNFINKKEYLAKLKEQFKDIKEDAQYTVEDIKKIISEWKELGYVPANKHYINVKFNKFINSLYDKLNIDKRELSFMKFKNTVDEYYEQENYRKLDNEKRFVRQKIEGILKEIQQLENNMMFIKSDDENNPFKREVEKNLKKNQEILEFWKKKLDYLNSLDY